MYFIWVDEIPSLQCHVIFVTIMRCTFIKDKVVGVGFDVRSHIRFDCTTALDEKQYFSSDL